MKDLKKKTLNDDNIIFDGKFYRYINYNDKLLTIGFSKKDELIKNKDIIRFSEDTIKRMKYRYDVHVD